MKVLNGVGDEMKWKLEFDEFKALILCGKKNLNYI